VASSAEAVKAAVATLNATQGKHNPESVTIPYYTARDVAAMTPDTPDWIIRGLLARQAVTEIDGKIKVAGKTTFITHAVRKVLDGMPFIELPTAKVKVVYVTEQTPGSFREALRRADLLDTDLRIVFRRDVAHIKWPDLVTQLTADALRDGYAVLVFDTLTKLARIKDEDNSGEAQAAMESLQNAAHDGLAIVVARHERKSGGPVGEAARGSSAFGGDADIILQIGRVDGDRPRVRKITSLSRYDDTPDGLHLELTESGYVRTGSSAETEVGAAIAILSPWLQGMEVDRKAIGGFTVTELTNLTNAKESTLRRAVARLEGLGFVVKSYQHLDKKRDTRANPARYQWLSGDDSEIGSVQPQPERVALKGTIDTGAGTDAASRRNAAGPWTEEEKAAVAAQW
jgi:hypothetical protein